MNLRERYESYKRGEYLKDFDNDRFQYIKILDRVPGHLRDELIHYDVKIGKRYKLMVLFMTLIYLGLGFLIGISIRM